MIWQMVTFIINGLVFILIGLQFRSILDAIDQRSTSSLIRDALLISFAVIAGADGLGLSRRRSDPPSPAITHRPRGGARRARDDDRRLVRDARRRGAGDGALGPMGDQLRDLRGATR